MTFVPSAPAPAIAAVAPVARAATPELVADRALGVTPGQLLAARVVSAGGGLVELAIAGGRMRARTDLSLAPGQALSLVVGEAGEERVSLRLAAAPAPGGGGAPLPAAPGLSAPAARALAAALADAGVPVPTPSGMTALAARAAAAGVSSPATAAAFARLLAAGLPVTPAAVAGLAELVEGPPVGRALAGVLDAAAPALPRALPAGGGPSPQAPVTAPAPARPDAAAPASASVAPAGDAAPPRAAGPPLAALVRELEGLVERVALGAVSGDGERLRGALHELGRELEARLAAGRPPEAAPVRSLLAALAAHPAADPALARAATGLVDAIGAQGLAAAAAPAAAADPFAAGAYLQVPLPGGQTAEIRVAPDAGRDGPGDDGRPRTLAFLLDLTALGPVAIQAIAGPGGVEAVVRLAAPEARRFVAGRLAELAEALEAGAGPARVRVEPLPAEAPRRLVAPPPASGLDLRA